MSNKGDIQNCAVLVVLQGWLENPSSKRKPRGGGGGGGGEITSGEPLVPPTIGMSAIDVIPNKFNQEI